MVAFPPGWWAKMVGDKKAHKEITTNSDNGCGGHCTRCGEHHYGDGLPINRPPRNTVEEIEREIEKRVGLISDMYPVFNILTKAKAGELDRIE